ncbi:MAG: class I SAM-dependent methyltransferase [Chloroflexota bacterium]|nr:class I SAM-dependent methyltransferase [Chloroflexota bacterium]
MGEAPYEYRGLKAQAWDLLRGDYSTWPDRWFYRDAIARSGEPALDVGCGTGRLVLDYLQQGIDCDGVDNSPEMLALCREKARRLELSPNLYEQRMQALELPRRYRTIFVPSSSFLLLTDPVDAAETMRRFFAHLEPDGLLLMPFMVLWPGAKPPQHDTWSGWFKAGEAKRPEDGATVRRHQRVKFDREQQLQHGEDRYQVVIGGRVVQEEVHLMSPATRWYTQEQSLAVYRAAGFADVRATNGFTFEPAAGDERGWTVFGTRP